MERVSDIVSSKVFPNNILAGLDPSIQLRIGGPTYLACQVKPSVLRILSGLQPASSRAPWGRVLMPKAPLFFHHFGLSIGDSLIYRSHIVQAAGPCPRVASGEGKHVVIAAIYRDR